MVEDALAVIARDLAVLDAVRTRHRDPVLDLELLRDAANGLIQDPAVLEIEDS